MPVIAHFSAAAYNPQQVTETELNGTDDSIVLAAGMNLLFVRNGSGSSQTITFVGSDSAGQGDCEGMGQVDLSTPVTFTVPDGQTFQMGLSSVRARLQGTITVTGAPANGLFAYILD